MASSPCVITTKNGACRCTTTARSLRFLILEGAQAGLSWKTILNKRENYRKAFAGFDPKRVARYERRKIERLLRDPPVWGGAALQRCGQGFISRCGFSR